MIQRQPRKVFAWHRLFLEALRADPSVTRACRAAGISRNSAYAHMRKNLAFRGRVESAVEQGRESAYRAHLNVLKTDPSFRRSMNRTMSAIEQWERRAQQSITA